MMCTVNYRNLNELPFVSREGARVVVETRAIACFWLRLQAAAAGVVFST